jgi:hypothetical protein
MSAILCWLVKIFTRYLIILHPKDKVTTDVTKSKCNLNKIEISVLAHYYYFTWPQKKNEPVGRSNFN